MCRTALQYKILELTAFHFTSAGLGCARRDIIIITSLYFRRFLFEEKDRQMKRALYLRTTHTT